MAIRLKTVLFSLFVVLVGLVLVAITAVGWQVVFGPDARPLTDRQFAPSASRLARGRYLVEGPASCFHCHSDHDLSQPGYPVKPGRQGAGWEMPIPELGRLYARNITSDPETGLGNWSDDEIARAIQEGVSRDGTALFPVMPYLSFRNFTDEDIASIVVYLRTVPAVQSVVPRSELPVPLNVLVKTMPVPLLTRTPDPARNTAEARGAYLVQVVANCGECHTPADRGQLLPGMDFGGGGLFHDPGQNMQNVFSANITSDASGIAHYDEGLFMDVMRTGQLPGRVLSHIMPFENFRNITDEDLRDIYAYIKSRPKVSHRVSNTDPPTLCPICKRSHGLGDRNKAGAGQ